MPNIKDFNLKFEVDVPEPRVYQGRLAVGLDGTSVSMPHCENIFQCPQTGTLMLRPLSLTPEWNNTFTGTGYVRLQKSDYTFVNSGNFHQCETRGSGDYFVHQYKGNEERFYTTGTYTSNSCFNLTFQNIGIESNSDLVFLKAEWNYNTTSDPRVAIWFYGNGKIQIYKNGTLVGDYDRTDVNFGNARRMVYTQALQNKYCDIAIIPFRNRSLLIHTNYGNTLVHDFVDLDPLVVNEILPGGSVSFWFPQKTGALQFSQMYFKTSGTIYGSPVVWRFAPPSAYGGYTVNTRTIKENFGATAAVPTVTPSIVRDTSGFPAMTYNGTNDQVRLKIALSSTNALSNVGIYCSDAWIDPPATTTYDGTVDVTSAITELSINMDEDGEVNGAVNFRRKRLIDLGIQKAGITADRPYRIRLTNVLSGTIEASTSSTTITGTGTKFLTELAVNDELFSAKGEVIGNISSIASDISLTLVANANINQTAGSFYYKSSLATGTVSVASSSTTLTGTSTLFLTQLSANQGLYTANTGTYIGKIASITNNISLTLTAHVAVITNAEFFAQNFNTGTITTSSASTTVTGSGTLFLSDLKPGDIVYRRDRTQIGIVSSIASNTSLTLTSNAAVTISTGEDYYSRTEKSSIDLVRGTLSSPTINYEPGDTNYNNSTLSFELRDRMYDLEIAQLTDSIPLDGMTFSEMLQNLFPVVGLTTSDYSVSTSTFTIPRNPEIAAGTYNLSPSREDTIKGIINRVKQDYAANWYTGWMPSYSGYKYYWIDPTTLSSTPKVTLYQSVQSSISAGFGQEDAQSRVIYNLKKQYEVPEANHIFVTGVDPASSALIYSFSNDTASQTPGTAPASRPNNWVGRTKAYILIDPSITTQTAANQARTILQNRLTTGRTLIEFESEILTKLDTDTKLNFMWLGDIVKIMMPNGTDVYGEFKIIAIPSITFLYDNDNFRIRRATYRCEMNGTNAAWYAEGLL